MASTFPDLQGAAPESNIQVLSPTYLPAYLQTDLGKNFQVLPNGSFVLVANGSTFSELYREFSRVASENGLTFEPLAVYGKLVEDIREAGIPRVTQGALLNPKGLGLDSPEFNQRLKGLEYPLADTHRGLIPSGIPLSNMVGITEPTAEVADLAVKSIIPNTKRQVIVFGVAVFATTAVTAAVSVDFAPLALISSLAVGSVGLAVAQSKVRHG